jgi:hypothetical protein
MKKTIMMVMALVVTEKMLRAASSHSSSILKVPAW